VRGISKKYIAILFRLNCKAARLTAKSPHLEIDRLNVTPEAVDVEQGTRQPVLGQSIAISFEK
jgi:hypothetical protein